MSEHASGEYPSARTRFARASLNVSQPGGHDHG